MSAPDLAVPTEFIDGKWCFPVLVGQEPSAVVTYATRPSPETGHVGWCFEAAVRYAKGFV